MKTGLRFVLALLIGLFCILIGVMIGSAGISLVDVITILKVNIFGGALPERIIKNTANIIWSIRLPRVLCAFLTGAMLSVSGAVMQSVLRNPLASSYTLGVSSGASLAAAVVTLSGFALPVVPFLSLPTAGFIGGILTVCASIGLAMRFDRNMQNVTIILTGMVLGLFVNAFLTITTAFSGDHLRMLVFWQMGSFEGLKWRNCAILLPILTVGLLLLQLFTREMDLMTFGDEQALSAGVDVKRTKVVLLGISTLLTGTAISFCGIIGFVDLIVPHITRRLFGSKHRIALPMNALIGGSFMIVCDLIARTILAPRTLPIGAITAICGAPFFAWIYFRRRGGRRHD
ncbi:MAG: iron ABC transporter permease [Clostridia bacterium]|nr:iron ABC transporter permease [Clostridia bacterium]